MVNAALEHPEQSEDLRRINHQAMDIIMRGVLTQEGMNQLKIMNKE